MEISKQRRKKKQDIKEKMEHPWLKILRTGHEKWHVVEQWASPFSTEEFWAGSLPPIGASLGLKNTRIWYRFKFLKETLKKDMCFRIVCQYCTEYPESQIHASADYETFINDIVTIESIEGNIATAYDCTNKKYVWDTNTNILSETEKYPWVNSANILVCVTPFTIRVNEDFFIDEEKTEGMEKKQQEDNFLYCAETLQENNELFAEPIEDNYLETSNVFNPQNEDFHFTLGEEDGVHEFFM
jgi:hypothetical protein